MILPQVRNWFKSKKITLKDDLIAGLIVAIVALPLALGFSIASGVDPAMGVYTAIIGGLFASLFGGSEYQISGPTGAMVVIILSVVAEHGVSGLIIASFVAGVILLIMSALKLGKIIEYIPSPVIVGFTAGIAFIIFFGQLNNFFGISPIYPADTEFFGKTLISLQQAFTGNIYAIIIAVCTIIILSAMPRINKRIPGSIVAVVLATAVTMTFSLGVKTVGNIGHIPKSLPLPVIPQLSWTIIWAVIPAALTIAALAAIESLLSAVVADGLTGTKHKPNQELMGQGIANIATSLFGGLPVTGAIARTATNIRNGGKSRLVGIFHALFLLLFVLVAGSLAENIPLAALAGILMYVAFNMVEWDRIFIIFRTPMSDIAVMITTFLLTIFVDLTVAIEVGLILASLLFMKRMSDLYKVEELEPSNVDLSQSMVRKFNHPDVSIYTIHGPLFFGAASRFDQQVATTPGGHKPIKIIRMKHVPVIDATGMSFLDATYKKHRRMGGVVLFSTVHPEVMKSLTKAGIVEKVGAKHFFATTKEAIAHALRHAKRLHNLPESVTPEEIAKYDLSDLERDDSQKADGITDTDPVEEVFKSLGVDMITENITKVTEAGFKIVENGHEHFKNRIHHKKK